VAGAAAGGVSSSHITVRCRPPPTRLVDHCWTCPELVRLHTARQQLAR
jgi:hypothetical protein